MRPSKSPQRMSRVLRQWEALGCSSPCCSPVNEIKALKCSLPAKGREWSPTCWCPASPPGSLLQSYPVKSAFFIWLLGLLLLLPRTQCMCQIQLLQVFLNFFCLPPPVSLCSSSECFANLDNYQCLDFLLARKVLHKHLTFLNKSKHPVRPFTWSGSQRGCRNEKRARQ